MRKKIVASLLLMTMLFSGMAIMPDTVDAAEEGYEDAIKYEDRTSEFKSLWKADGTSGIPTKEGYVFGGWYVEGASAKEALNVEAATEKLSTNPTEGVYAKFVPAYVLSVKTQHEESAAPNNGASAVRVISALDSTNYEKVGFDVYINNKNKLYHAADSDGVKNDELETTTVYTGLIVGNDTENPRKADKIFGKEAEFLSVWRLSDIADTHDAKIINVTPYWYTLDGTKVSGLTKYIHIEDGYKDYINVPVNLRTAAMIAAGRLTMTYNSDILELADTENAVEYAHNNTVVTVNGITLNGIFKSAEMTFADDKEGNISISGNADVVGTNVAANGLFANVRFHIKDKTNYPGSTSEEFLTFELKNENFCNWDEQDVTVNAWNIQH